jgi:oligoribonuclease NrnB/cAMP/cGMP phosphodiesterase (DHH superfamily)
MKCFYHRDADGRCAGHLVNLWDCSPDKMFIGINYEDIFPLHEIKKGERVYIVDFSISPDCMRQLLEITTDIIWIDHHKTAIDKYKDFEWDIPGIRINGVAGCMLTYIYLYHMLNKDGVKNNFSYFYSDYAPLYVKLIADYDVWNFEYGDDTRHFQMAFSAYDFNPESPQWNDFNSPYKSNMEYFYINQGEIMMLWRDNWAKSFMKYGFHVDLGGLKCFAANLGHCNSDYFKSVEGDYDAFIAFLYTGKSWRISMYANKPDVDVSKVCAKYGGGGHKGAAGFHCEELPFRIEKDELETLFEESKEYVRLDPSTILKKGRQY